MEEYLGILFKQIELQLWCLRVRTRLVYVPRGACFAPSQAAELASLLLAGISLDGVCVYAYMLTVKQNKKRNY